MAKRVLLNIFFNIAIFTLLLCNVWLFNHGHYGLMAGALFGLAIFIYFKLRLVKEVKAYIKKSR